MHGLFSKQGRARLAALVAAKPLLGFDFDGTLAPLAEQPDRAAMRAPTRRLLVALARQFPVVVISGRSRADVARRCRGVPVAGVAGNHGIEPFGQSVRVERLVASWHKALDRDLADVQDVFIEDKRYSLTVDYRHSPDLEDAEAAIRRAARRLPGARLLGGRHADFNIAPEGAPNKGTAMRRFMRAERRTAALYVGDDRTDEDVFALDLPGLLTVRIGQRRGSRADYFLPKQSEMDKLLGVLGELAELKNEE